MPRVWSWNHDVAARWVLGYWKTAKPLPQVVSNADVAFRRKNENHLPTGE